MTEALLIYKEYADMDAADYADTMESDIAYIAELVSALGVAGTKEFLRGMME